MKDRRHDAKGRSTGRPIAARAKHSKIEGQFAPRTIEMIRSPAMQALSLTGRRILDRLEIEIANHGGAENGSLPVTYDDFERFGIHRHQIAAGLAEVVALGFAEITRLGRAGNAEHRLPTLYRVTYRPTEYAAPTNEWKRFGTNEEAEAAARGSRQRWRDRAKKQISSGGKRQISVSETTTENTQIHSAETATTDRSAETTTTLDISGRGRTNKPIEHTCSDSIPDAMAAIAAAVRIELGEGAA